MRLSHRVKRIERALNPPPPMPIPFSREQTERAQRMVARWQSDPVRYRTYLDLIEQARLQLAAKPGRAFT